MKISNLIKLTIPFLLTFETIAAANEFLTIEPIVGYERVQKFSPTVHTADRLIYGARATYGLSLASLEAQVTQGNDTESFPLQDLEIKEEVINAMLGLKSSIRFGVLSFFLRAGGHARKSKVSTTEAGVTTIEEPGINISPYAGTGLGINFSNMIKINAGVTAIFTGKPKGSDQEYQTTLGFAIKI